MKKVLCLVLTLIMLSGAVPVLAENPYNVFVTEKTGSVITITGVKNESVAELTVPAHIFGKKVQIAPYAFSNLKNLEKVTIEEDVKILPEQCFSWSRSLKEVNLPYSLTQIDKCAFLNCDSITEIDLKNVRVVGDYAFEENDNLAKVTHNGALEEIGYQAFYGCAKLEAIDLSTVKILKGEAFSNCNNLTEVKLLSLEQWDGIKENDVNAETRKYYRNQIPAYHGGYSSYFGVEYGIESPFKYCQNLTTVTVAFPENTTGEDFPSLFFGCTNLKNVYIEKYRQGISKWEFATVSFDNSKGYIYIEKPSENVRIYSADINVKQYADSIGVKFSLTAQDENYIFNLLDSMLTGNVGVIKVDIIGKNSVAVEAFKTQTPKMTVQLKNSSGEWISVNNLITMVYHKAYSREITLNYNKPGTDTYTKGRISCAFLNSQDKEYWLEFDIPEEPPIVLLEEKYVTVQEEEITRLGLNIVDYEGVENPVYITEFLTLSNTEYRGSSDSIEFTFNDETYLLKAGDANSYKDEKGNIIVGEVFFRNVLGLETLVRNKILVVSVKKTYDVEYKESELTKKENKIDLKDTDITMSIMTEPQNGPDNLYDGDFVSYCTLYVADAFNPEYIQIDLKEVKNIDFVEMAFRNATERTTYFDIRVSEDGESFTTVLPMTGSSRLTNEMQEFEINKNARYIRIYGYSNTFNIKWVSITELAVYAS